MPGEVIRWSGPVLAALLLLLQGCASPRGKYEQALDIVNQYRLPDGGDAEDALEDLDDAIRLAKEDLEEDEDLCTPCLHDRTAYIIPLAHLAKAKLHARFNQVSEQERACWMAVREAESYLGHHIRKISPGSGGTRWNLLFGNYSVFFRREKIRRHAFTLLQETYRQAGERDLQALARMQINFSDIYLRSPFAHVEEEYIRAVENSDGLRLYDLEQEEIGHGVLMTFLVLATAAQVAAIQQQQADLQAQGTAPQSAAAQAEMQNQMAMLNAQMQQTLTSSMAAMQMLNEQHAATVQSIEHRHQTTVVQALVSNFRMLELSDEVKQLAAYRELKRRQEAFDNYVLTRGFDPEAARALMDIRTSLDDLTRELQYRRRTDH